MMDKTGDPTDGKGVAAAIFIAVAVYAVGSNHHTFAIIPNLTLQGFFLFCGLQAALHIIQSRRGQISLT